MLPRSTRGRRVLRVTLVCACLAGAVIAVAAATGPERSLGAARVLTTTRPRALSAGRFLDSVGVNTHITYLDTSYQNVHRWLGELRSLGVHHIRDTLAVGSTYERGVLGQLAHVGIRATLIADARRSPAASVRVAIGALRRDIDALENPNEPDVQLGRHWPRIVRRFVRGLGIALSRSARRHLPLLSPGFASPANNRRIANLTRFWSVENLHSYPGGQDPSFRFDYPLAVGRQTDPGTVLFNTETGYHNATRATYEQPGVSERAAAIYIPRLLLQYFGAGIRRTFLYELLDERPNPRRNNPENHFGLIRANMVPKPAYLAVRNLLAIVARSPGRGSSRSVSVTSPAGRVETVLLSRRDGSRVLFLWRIGRVYNTARRRDVRVSPIAVRVRWDRPGAAGEIVDPTLASAGKPFADSGRGLSMELGGDVLAVSFR